MVTVVSTVSGRTSGFELNVGDMTGEKSSHRGPAAKQETHVNKYEHAETQIQVVHIHSTLSTDLVCGS